MLPAPVTLMLPVLLETAWMPAVMAEMLELNVIAVLPLPPVSDELMPMPAAELTVARGIVVTATFPPLLLILIASPAPVFAIGFGPLADTTLRSMLNPPTPPEMVTPPVVTVSL